MGAQVQDFSEVDRGKSELVEVAWDPITRIVGSLGIYTKIDFGRRAWRSATALHRSFAAIQHLHAGQGSARCALHHQPHLRHLRRQSRDLLRLRAEHGVRRRAAGTWPSGSSIWARRPSTCSTTTSSRTTWWAWISARRWCAKPIPASGKRRERTEAPHAEAHGYRTIGDIMKSLNPFEGEFYREALQMSRLTREMFCLMEGRHVHPSTLYPGGVGTVPTIQLFTDYLVRLMKYVEFMKKVVPLHDDLFDFFYEALPGYEEVGQRRVLLGCWGCVPESRGLRLHVQQHGRSGAARCTSPPASWWTASW